PKLHSFQSLSNMPSLQEKIAISSLFIKTERWARCRLYLMKGVDVKERAAVRKQSRNGNICHIDRIILSA
ncbi:MAG: hypothetical protein IJH59_04930, partial [Firmicutes bacterium]|nr:hypothetical protein [Bacillota bacterium]